MIKHFLAWLKSLYYTPASEAETQASGDIISEPLVDTSAQAQTAAPANTSLQSDIPVEASTSALDKAKAEFEAFVAFVEHGIEVLGAKAEIELVALKDKYL